MLASSEARLEAPKGAFVGDSMRNNYLFAQPFALLLPVGFEGLLLRKRNLTFNLLDPDQRRQTLCYTNSKIILLRIC